MLCLIDGDVLFYQYAFPYEQTIEWDSDHTTKTTQPELAKYGVDTFIQSLVDITLADDYLVMYSGDFNFRYGIFPDYKHNRANKEKPELYSVLKNHILENHPTECWEGIEADDALGIRGNRGDGVICTIDKDLYTVPSVVYNWNKMGKPQTISEDYANWFWMYQVLTGDSVDGYKGCPLIGDKKARAILECGTPLMEMWTTVVRAYENVSSKQAMKGYGKEKLTEEDAIIQAQVARILREEDWNIKKQKPILWRPEKCIT